MRSVHRVNHHRQTVKVTPSRSHTEGHFRRPALDKFSSTNNVLHSRFPTSTTTPPGGQSSNWVVVFFLVPFRGGGIARIAGIGGFGRCLQDAVSVMVELSWRHVRENQLPPSGRVAMVTWERSWSMSIDVPGCLSMAQLALKQKHRTMREGRNENGRRWTTLK
ncbi:hypothetical protein NP493_801g02065 [Ridgeia piscesae]|uniref:Uncharacterized protein n=1 Tax=Ridgeia piscesae TaxID=27915 RepID=A0AAD9KNF3_RIDPI|nr:hypothetical protein NP493_801g02065 [Ridgeia piscesae]